MKRFLMILLAGVVALTAAACGGSPSTTSSVEAPTSSHATESARAEIDELDLDRSFGAVNYKASSGWIEDMNADSNAYTFKNGNDTVVITVYDSGLDSPWSEYMETGMSEQAIRQMADTLAPRATMFDQKGDSGRLWTFAGLSEDSEQISSGIMLAPPTDDHLYIVFGLYNSDADDSTKEIWGDFIGSVGFGDD